MEISFPTTSIPAAWEGHGETIILRIFRRSTGGATGKKDRAEGDVGENIPSLDYFAHRFSAGEVPEDSEVSPNNASNALLPVSPLEVVAERN